MPRHRVTPPIRPSRRKLRTSSSRTHSSEILLNRIREISQTARATWFGLLALLAFIGVTILGHNDSDFFARGAEAQLPLIGITVPTHNFFAAAPVLVAVLYVYLNLYLLELWDALGKAPARVGGRPLSDRLFPTLISGAAITYRDRSRRDGSAVRRTLSWSNAVFSTLLIWGAGIVALAVLWWRSMPAHEEWMTLWIALWLWVAIVVGVSTFRYARKQVRAKIDTRAGWRARTSKTILTSLRIVFAVSILIILFFISWLRTEGGFEFYKKYINNLLTIINKDSNYTITSEILPNTNQLAKLTGYHALQSKLESESDPSISLLVKYTLSSWLNLYPTNLAEARLTPYPDDWKPYQLWREDFEDAFRARHGLAPRGAPFNEPLSEEVKTIFELEAESRYAHPVSTLDGAFMRGADLRNADLRNAFLPSSDLRNARIEGADLRAAQMQGASLTAAQMRGADLSAAQMQGADLRKANMQGAVLLGADLQGVALAEAQMQGADLNSAQMQGADLHNAQLQEATLVGAQLQRAILRGAVLRQAILVETQMRRAILVGAQMHGAVFRGADMQGAQFRWARMPGAILAGARLDEADFFRADMRGVVLVGATMRDADCDRAVLRGALLLSADLACESLVQEKLNGAVGDYQTAVPRGISVASCLEDVPEDIDATLAYYQDESKFAELSRAEIRDALLCAEGETPHATGVTNFELHIQNR